MYGGWIIGIVLVVVLLLVLSRGGISQRNNNKAAGSNSTVSPMETLKNRYAKGEIDQAEFEKRKRELE